MKTTNVFFQYCFIFLIHCFNGNCQDSISDTIPRREKVTLAEAHIGNLTIDTHILDSYEFLPDNERSFYFDARSIFFENMDADFTHPRIIKSANKNNLPLIGGPMLGNLSDDSVTIWVRPAISEPIVVALTNNDGSYKKKFRINIINPGVEQRIILDGLTPDTDYKYVISSERKDIAEGRFTTAPSPYSKGVFRVAFGSGFHKIGLHNPNLINHIVKRNPQAMMLLGDIAVDDRDNLVNLHRSDYLLRDVSNAWQHLAANVPLYTSWDDHDYFNNDLGGIPERFTVRDRDNLRSVWKQNWNNPKTENSNIFFKTQIGPVELIMLDTRSCRDNQKRGEYGSYLGQEQLYWLKETLKNSVAPFKIVSSGTMWSDYITKGKDSWGTWDTETREEIFNFIESENISGVLLISGDRHGARGFTIPRSSGFSFHEFEVASLGGVPGPNAMAKNATHQLFGYHGEDVIAFGEFTFHTTDDKVSTVFRLIDEFGNILEEHILPYSKLTPSVK